MLRIQSAPSSVRNSSSRRNAVKVQAAGWTKVATKDTIKAAGGKQVVEVSGKKILLAEVEGEVFAVSNVCSHLNLPLVGKTQFFQGKVNDGCITCAAHGTAFDLKTGEVKGDWCPNFPNLPLVGKLKGPAPLPIFESRVDEAGNVEVMA